MSDEYSTDILYPLPSFPSRELRESDEPGYRNTIKRQRRNGKHVEITPCYYCGMPATSIDHVIPTSFIQDLKSVGDYELLQDIDWNRRRRTVPACRECNSMLSDSVQDNLEERKRDAKALIRRKYRHSLAAPDWSEEDIARLGTTLRSYVTRSQQIKDITRLRLAW